MPQQHTSTLMHPCGASLLYCMGDLSSPYPCNSPTLCCVQCPLLCANPLLLCANPPLLCAMHMPCMNESMRSTGPPPPTSLSSPLQCCTMNSPPPFCATRICVLLTRPTAPLSFACQANTPHKPTPFHLCSPFISHSSQTHPITTTTGLSFVSTLHLPLLQTHPITTTHRPPPG